MGKRGRTPVVYTLERAKEVRRRVREGGERVSAVCAELGMNFENFLRWCRRNRFRVHSAESRIRARAAKRGAYALGEKVNPLREPREGGRAAAIVEDWKAQKLSPREIAEKHGVGYPYVIRLRKLCGLNPPVGKGRNIRDLQKRTNLLQAERNELVWSELDAGRPVVEVSKRLGLSRQRIYQLKQQRPAV